MFGEFGFDTALLPMSYSIASCGLTVLLVGHLPNYNLLLSFAFEQTKPPIKYWKFSFLSFSRLYRFMTYSSSLLFDSDAATGKRTDFKGKHASLDDFSSDDGSDFDDDEDNHPRRHHKAASHRAPNAVVVKQGFKLAVRYQPI